MPFIKFRKWPASYKKCSHPYALFIPKFVNLLQAFNRLAVCTSTEAVGVSGITAQFHFPLGPFLKRPHFPQKNMYELGESYTLCIFETLGEVKGRYFLQGSVLLLLTSQTKPGCDLGTKKKKGTKSKTFVVSPGKWKWASSAPTLGSSPGRSSAGVAGSGAGERHPRGRAHGLTISAAPQTEPSLDSLGQASRGSGDLRKSPELLRPWDARQSPPAQAGCASSAVISGGARVCHPSRRSTSRAAPVAGSGVKMPALHIEDLPEKEKLKMEVEQLRKEVKLQRQQVSKCSEEIKNYIEERSGEDPLVKGIPEDKNPFKEKGSCIIS
uniref:Guanine nucleotide-binding protein subunit gamma n=1 Tax=Sus scrofa TaxID=9823 RepID=A0A8D1FIL5_PIG